MISFNDFQLIYKKIVRNPLYLDDPKNIKPCDPFRFLRVLCRKPTFNHNRIFLSLDELQSIEFVAVSTFISLNHSLTPKNYSPKFFATLKICSAICNQSKKILRHRLLKAKFFSKYFKTVSLDDSNSFEIPDPKASDAFTLVELNLLLESCCRDSAKPNQKLFNAIQSILNHKTDSLESFALSKATFQRKIQEIKPRFKSFVYF